MLLTKLLTGVLKAIKVDYVVEERAWALGYEEFRYRIWKSGISEFWYRIDRPNGVSTKVWVSPIYYNDYNTWSNVFSNAKSGLFNSTPMVSVTSCNNQFLSFIPQGITKDGIGILRPISVGTKSNLAHSFTIYAIGTWK